MNRPSDSAGYITPYGTEVRISGSALRELTVILTPILIGLVTAFLLLRQVLIPTVGMSQAQRIVDLVNR